MAYKLQLKRGVLASLPNGSVGEPLFTTDTFDLYVGKGDGTNVKIQKFIASGSSSQFLKGDGSLDSNTYIGLTALSASAPLSYNNTTGAFTISQAGGSTNGYLSSVDWTTFNAKQAALSGSGIVKSTGGTISYLTDNSVNWDTAYNDKINSASVSGTTTKTLTLTQQDGGTITTSWSDYDTAPVTSVFGRTGAVVAANGDYTTSQVTEGTNLYYTDARARAAITLTTTGSSGASTYVGGTLNIPTYTLAGLGGVASSRQLNINGTSYDLSADRSWSVGTVTSVDMSVPTGFAISGNPITSSGTLALAFASGYSLPTNASQTNWDAAYNDKINSASVSGTTTKTLTLTQQDGGTITASWSDYDTAPVTSVFGRTGVVTAQSGDYTTTQVTEGTNLYYTDTRVSANTDVAANTAARHSAVTLGTANGLSLSTQQLSLGLSSGSTTGALSSTDWTTFNSKQAALNGTGFVKISGTTISYDNSTYYLASNPSSYIAKTDLSAVTPLSYDNVTGVFQMTQANSTTSGYITSTDWNTFNNKQSALTNPVTGTGTTNYLPKFTGSTTIGNSNFFINSDNLVTSSSPYIYSNAATGGTVIDAGLKIDGANKYVSFWNVDAERMRLTSTGLGIGTTNPLVKLEIVGDYRQKALVGNSNGFNISINSSTDVVSLMNYYNAGLVFGVNNAEGMRLTSTGLGIGTTTFATDSKLAVQTSGGKFDVRGIGVASIVLESNGGMHYNAPTGNFHKFQINNSTLMELNGSGNLGLGVSPSAWYSTFQAFQFGANGSSIFGRSENNMAAFASNAYVNASGNFTYINTNTASYYQQLNGQHQWYNAPSGTAGNAISFTQAMTLDASGQLLIGLTSNTGGGRLEVQSNATSAITTRASSSGTGQTVKSIRAVNSAADQFANAQYDALSHAWILSNSTQAMTLTSGGNVGIGTTSPASTLDVSGTGRFTGALTGTSATFSGNVRKTGAAGVYTELQSDGVYATGTDLYLLAPSTKGVYIYTNNTQALSISSTGTATFSSSVTAVGLASTGTNHLYNGVELRFYNSNNTNWGVIKGSSSTSLGDISITGGSGNGMFIASGGNIGIGTTSPADKLVVEGSDVNVTAKSTSNVSAFKLINTSGTSVMAQVNNALVFEHLGTERMRVTSGGLVGIGTSSPAAPLHINSSGTTNMYIQSAAGNGAVLRYFVGTSEAATARVDASANYYIETGLGGPTERIRIKSNGSVRYIPMATPSTAEAGDVYYDSTSNKLRCYNGTSWNDLF